MAKALNYSQRVKINVLMNDGPDSLTEHAAAITINYPISSYCFTVVNTANEPIVGWINNLYGAAGVVAGAGIGLLKSMYCDKAILADTVPVDMAINAAIAIAWDVAQHT
jgi:hypothetical protein